MQVTNLLLYMKYMYLVVYNGLTYWWKFLCKFSLPMGLKLVAIQDPNAKLISKKLLVQWINDILLGFNRKALYGGSSIADIGCSLY